MPWCSSAYKWDLLYFQLTKHLWIAASGFLIHQFLLLDSVGIGNVSFICLVHHTWSLVFLYVCSLFRFPPSPGGINLSIKLPYFIIWFPRLSLLYLLTILSYHDFLGILLNILRFKWLFIFTFKENGFLFIYTPFYSPQLLFYLCLSILFLPTFFLYSSRNYSNIVIDNTWCSSLNFHSSSNVRKSKFNNLFFLLTAHFRFLI